MMLGSHGLSQVSRRMASRTEEAVSRSLRLVLNGLTNGAAIEDSENFRNLLSGLEFFLPSVLGEVHQEWRNENMDRIFSAVARKTGPNEAEIIGLCILISDQTLTPIQVRIRVSATKDEIEWIECNVGESGEGRGGMLRTPYNAMSGRQLMAVAERVSVIDWAFRVGFGERQPIEKTRPCNF
jgi:hypothetical protein